MSKKAELIGNYYGAIYLTVISLLQGIALSQLVPIIITFFQITDQPWSDVHIVPLLIMLIVIFIVWHHYAIGIFFLRWFPNIIDTAIPFLISIGQFFLISFLGIRTSANDIQLEAWSQGFALFLIVGGVPYFNAAFRTKGEFFTNVMSLENANAHSLHVRKYYIMAGLAILIQGVFALVISLMGAYQWLFFSLLLLAVYVVSAEYFLLANIKRHFVKSIDEFDAAARDKAGL